MAGFSPLEFFEKFRGAVVRDDDGVYIYVLHARLRARFLILKCAPGISGIEGPGSAVSVRKRVCRAWFWKSTDKPRVDD